MQRNNSIDIARGIGILLVVFGHNWLVINDKGSLFRVIFSFHLPLFFFLSGVFLKETQSFSDLLASKTASLLKPYFVVLSILWVLKAPFGGTGATSYFLGVLYGTGGTIQWGPLWFLPHLFLSYLLSWTVLRATARLPGRVPALALCAGLMLAVGVAYIELFRHFDTAALGLANKIAHKPDTPLGLPCSLDLILISSAFLLLGHICQQAIKTMRFQRLWFGAALLLFCGLHYLFNATIDFNMRIYGSLLVCTMQALAGIYLTLSLSLLLARDRVVAPLLAHIGGASLFILLFHSFAEGQSFQVLSRICPSHVLNGLLSFVAGVAVPLAIYAAAQRSPFLAALLLPGKPHTRILPLPTAS